MRVIQARALPVDLSVLKDGPAPYVWITTAPNDKKRATRKVTVPPSKDSGSFFAALKKAAGAVGLGPSGSGQHKILKEAFTEVGRGVEHVWDEEFTLLVDKVGQRLLRAEAVDDRLRQGKDSLGALAVCLCVDLCCLFVRRSLPKMFCAYGVCICLQPCVHPDKHTIRTRECCNRVAATGKAGAQLCRRAVQKCGRAIAAVA